MKFNLMALAILLASGSLAFGLAESDLEQTDEIPAFEIPADIQNELDALKQRNEQSSVVPKQDINAQAKEQAELQKAPSQQPEENGFVNENLPSDDLIGLDQLGFEE